MLYTCRYLFFVFVSGHILEHVVPLPEYKLLTLENIPQISEKSMEYSIFQWHGLLKHFRQMLLADSAMEEGNSAQPHRADIYLLFIIHLTLSCVMGCLTITDPRSWY